MGKKDKHDRKKRSRKKHKKEKKKKYKKEKKSKSRKISSDSSDSESCTSGSSFSSDREERKVTEKAAKNPVDSKNEAEWMELFSDKHAIIKEKPMQKKESGQILDKPGQSARELNPYWKDGGNGLPPEWNDTSDSRHNSRVSRYPQADQKLHSPGFDQRMREATRSPFEGHKGKLETGAQKEIRLNFKKPGEISDLEFWNARKQNWKKREFHVPEETIPSKSPQRDESEEDTSECKPMLTADELNALVAKAMKAEIMGNKALSEQLKKEIEAAKGNRKKSLPGRSKTESEKEVVLLMTTNKKGFTKPSEVSECGGDSRGRRKKQKVATHRENERMKYFADDDKHSLKSMFEKEKFGTTDEDQEIFLNMSKKAKNRANEDDLDDDFLDRIRGSEFKRKANEKERNRSVREARAKHESVSSCRWCLDNCDKHTMISLGDKCYLCLPTSESLTDGHSLIVPINHDTCGTALDEDTWEEIQLYRKTLCKMFEDCGMDVIFYENARSFHRFPHMILNCVPVEKESGDLAPIYFKKAIQESETEWSNNKKLIDLRCKDLRRSIPKGLPYFAVDFGREGGFAHVIEDEKLFPVNFAEEIIGGMLDLDPIKFRKRRRESSDVQREKVLEFSKKWKKYDFTSRRKRPHRDSSSSDSD